MSTASPPTPQAPPVHRRPKLFFLLTVMLRQQGFIPGTPPGLTDTSMTVDRAVCRYLSCPQCGKRGLIYHPFHRPADGRYRIAAQCKHGCGGGAEV